METDNEGFERYVEGSGIGVVEDVVVVVFDEEIEQNSFADVKIFRGVVREIRCKIAIVG